MNKQNFKELSNILKEKFNHKNDLIQWIGKNLEIKISKSNSYEKILFILIEKDKENEFSKKMYSCDSFLQIIEKRDIHDSLDIFSKEELKILAINLSQNQKLWKYDTFSVDKLRKTIVKNCNLKQFEKLFPKLIQEKKIDPVMQYYKSVIGPLGITHSKIDRKSMEADELVSFLSTYVTHKTFKQILEQTNFKKILDKHDFDEKLSTFALQQCLLSYENQDGLIRIFDNVIEKEIIKIINMERFGDFIVTPCGVIVGEYGDPVRNLIHILLERIPKQNLKEELDLEGIQPGPLESRLYIKCAQTRPEELLLNEFGRTDLKNIGKKLGLVRVNKISDINELIKYVLIRLGFYLPEEIKGISEYVRILETLKGQLKNQSKSEYPAVITKTYILTERMLKDLIYFHSFLFWKDITTIEDRRDRIESVNEKLKSEFSIDKDLAMLGLGQLIGLMKKMNRYFSENLKLKTKLKNQLGRSTLFPSEYISSIAKLNDNRSKFTHDVTSEVFLNNKLNPEEIINETIRITKKFGVQKIYPTAFRTLKEITNEYNISYYEILDEYGNLFPVFSEEFLEPGKTGFLISKTDKIAVNPIVIQKYW